MLGVDENASLAAIKRAYYEKARMYHPDRHYSLPEDMKEKLNAVFSYITAAYSTLISPDLRAQYDNRPVVVESEQHASNEEIAGQRFREGMHALERADYLDAAQLFGAAAYLRPSVPKYHFFNGMALSKGGKIKEAERAISRALKADPFNAVYLAEVGHLYLKLGLPLRARGNFQRALNIQPGNKRALQGIEKLASELSE